MKIKHDQHLRRLAQSGFFRVNADGRIETNRKWNGHRDVEVDWYICDREDGKGYRYVSWHMVRVKAHRLAYCLYHPEDDITGFEINHLDGDRQNNREENLEKCDASRQSSHAYAIGLNTQRGVRHNLSKLSPAKVRAIRRLRALGVPYARIARKFDVTPRSIVLVCKRETWSHVK